MRGGQIEELTARQKDCLRLLLTGRSAKQIAAELGISPGTVEGHLKAARRLLGVNDSGDAARMLLAHEQTAPQEVGIQPRGLSESASTRSFQFQRQGATYVDPLLLHEQRLPFDAAPEPPRLRDWFLRSKGRRNELTVRQRLVSIAVLTLGLLAGFALGVTMIVLLLDLFISLSRHGG